MFRFEHPGFLWLLICVPVLACVWVFSRWLVRRSCRKFATEKAMDRLLAEWSAWRSGLKSLLVLLAVSLICMALANPQWGVRRESVQAESADVFIALDISNSMYAQDIAPSRMERAKKFAIDLIHGLRGERIGLVLFAGNAYLQMPLTTDYAAAELFVRSAHPGLASTQGTAIGEAIELAMKAYTDEETHQKALIVLTDGENHEEGVMEAMSTAKDAGLVPFFIAVGTEEGAFIPVVVQGREDYKRDEHGAPVRSAVNEAFLRDLAKTGRGHLYHILDGEFVVRDIRDKIDLLEKRVMEQQAFKDFESYYQYFLFGAILLLLVATVLPVRRHERALNHL